MKHTGKLGENKYTFRYWGNTGYNLTTRPLTFS